MSQRNDHDRPGNSMAKKAKTAPAILGVPNLQRAHLAPTKFLFVSEIEAVNFSKSPGHPRFKMKLKVILKNLFRYPYHFGICGGFAFLHFNKEKDFIFSVCSLSFIMLVLQGSLIFLQSLIYLGVLRGFSNHHDQLHQIGETGAEHFVQVAIQCLNAMGQEVLRLTYILRRHRYANFHRKLVDLSTKIMSIGTKQVDEENPEGVGIFLKLTQEIRWITRGFALCWMFSLAVMATLSHFGSSGGVGIAAGTNQGFPAWLKGLLSVMNLDFTLVNAFYAAHSIWYATYIKWMDVLFGLLAKKSEGTGTGNGGREGKAVQVMQVLDELEGVVKEFNYLFHLPVASWLFVICSSVVTNAFFIMSWMSAGLFQRSALFASSLLFRIISLFFLADVGATFMRHVQRSVTVICKNLAVGLRRRQEEDSRIVVFPNKLNSGESSSELHDQVMLLHQRLQCNPITISPGDYFTLNRRMLTSIAGTISTYLVVLLQFKDGEAG